VLYDVVDVSSWQVMSQEARGLDKKDWIARPAEVRTEGEAHWWLFKPVKSAGYRRHDDTAEKVASELAKLIGIPAATVELARGKDEVGVISRNVTPNGWGLDSGDTILSELPGYIPIGGDTRPKNRVGHTLANIEAVLDGCFGPPSSDCQSWRAFEVFAGYLVFDAWIANTDRHAINWSVLTNRASGDTRLAASFDHGSALASGVQEERLDEDWAAAFPTRGVASRFEGGGTVTLVELAVQAVRQAGGRSVEWQDRLSRLEPTAWAGIVEGIPGLSVARRTFISSLLTTNQRRLG
jgi:hypothetical protein